MPGGEAVATPVTLTDSQSGQVLEVQAKVADEQARPPQEWIVEGVESKGLKMEQQAKPSTEQVSTRMTDALVEFGADAQRLSPEATLQELDIDSLDLFELGQILHNEFGIEVDPQDLSDVTTLGELQTAMLSRLR